MLSVVAAMTVGVRLIIEIVGWVGARCPGRGGSHICVVVHPTDERCALHLGNGLIKLERETAEAVVLGSHLIDLHIAHDRIQVPSPATHCVEGPGPIAHVLDTERYCL